MESREDSINCEDAQVEEDEEFQCLVTRYSAYTRIHQQSTDSLTSTPLRKSLRATDFLCCEEHKNEKSYIYGCANCLYFPVEEHLPNGRLPTTKQIIAYVLWTNKTNFGKSNLNDICSDLMLHWILTNVYTITKKNALVKLENTMKKYNDLRKYPTKKKGVTYYSRLADFNMECDRIFDIKCCDPIRIKDQEKKWRVKLDDAFYQCMCQVPQEGYSTQSVDRKWLKSTLRRQKDETSTAQRLHDSWHEMPQDSCKDLSDLALGLVEDDLDINDNEDNADESYTPEKKKGKYQFNNNKNVGSSTDDKDEMPYKYQFIRQGLRSVRPEMYTLMHKLSSQYHMSKAQIEGSIIAIANTLFGRQYKCKEITDLNTLPSMKNMLHTEPSFEAMALCAIVEEVMKDSNHATIVYSNDGSSMSGVGAYMVQSLSINGDQRCLPTMGIFTESRESLKELEITTLKILSAACGHKYSAQQILRKISFVMTDSTAHNVKVIELVCHELGVTEVPGTLLCNVHPLMMFQGKIKELCQEIHDSLGHRKITDCFLVDVEFRNESFVVKSLKCLSNFINKDYSSKPWNRCSHFESFIKPKENKSLSLKDHRFNRLSDCALSILYHMDDIACYLEKYDHIINGISILDRSFVDMEVLKPIYGAIALLGHHILNPYLHMLIDPRTKYSMLLKAFPQLYSELTDTPAESLLTVDQVLHFVPQDIFKDHLPDKTLLDALSELIQSYPQEITQLLALSMKKFSSGFALQKGAIFGFGEGATNDTGSVLKISELDEKKLEQLDNAPTHNLAEERSVGFFNYELNIRGKKNTEAASRKMILNKSADLIFKPEFTTNYRKFKKEAAEIHELKLEWNSKMAQLQEEGYDKKDLNTKTESQKLRDLEFLKSQGIPGPFTMSQEVENFMDIFPENKEKNHRMYIEIRFQRNTSKTLKSDCKIFRLKEGGKNLTTSDYATNLCKYLDQSRSIGTLSLGDLRNVLTGLRGGSIESGDHVQRIPPSIESIEGNSQFTIGEAVACIWHDDAINNINWYLGVVDNITGGLYVSYMKRSDNAGLSWLFPEEAEIRLTNLDQVIARNVQIEYNLTAIIRCRINKETLQNIQMSFDNVKN